MHRTIRKILISLVCLMSLMACGDDSDNSSMDVPTPDGAMTVDMGTTDASAMMVDDLSMPEADMGPTPMPEGEGALWRLQVALVEFGVEVPFQLELKRGDGQFDFARVRAFKDGMLSEPISWVLDVPIAEDGTFTISFDEMTIPGPFSPTLDDVAIVLVISATAVSEDQFCGQITGDVVTLDTPVTMSTFGAVPWENEAPYPSSCNADVETFDPIETCPMIAAGDNEGFLSAGLERHFRVMLPDDYDENVASRLLFAYHGKNGEMLPWGRIDKFALESQLAEAANRNNTILVWVGSQGLGSEWESGTVGPTRDLAFFDDLNTCLGMAYNIDPTRIHAVGHSAGSYHTAMLSLARGSVLASAAVGSTGLLLEYQQPEIPIPIMALWGGPDDSAFMQDFHRQTLALIDTFANGGHIVVACRHDNLPLEGDNRRHTWQPPTNEWIFDFLQQHPKGTERSPYAANGVPAGWAAQCELYPMPE